MSNIENHSVEPNQSDQGLPIPGTEIKIERVNTRMPLTILRKYRLEVPGTNSDDKESIVLRRGAAVAYLMGKVGIGEAWSSVNAADAALDTDKK